MMKNALTLSLLLLTYQISGSHWNEEQVALYVNASELQRRSSWQLLSQVKFSGNEQVLDVGCGDGRNSAWISRLVRDGTVVGIDPSEAMISWAKKQYHSQDFPNLRFGNGDANSFPGESFDVITAFFSLHIVKDLPGAAKEFYTHLNKGGEVIAVIPPKPSLNPPFDEAIKETISSERWSPYFAQFRPTFVFSDLEDYRRAFEEAGFTVTRAEFVPSVDPFVTKREFANWFTGTWPYMHYLPEEERIAFAEEIADRFAKKRPEALSPEGAYSFYWGRLELLAKK